MFLDTLPLTFLCTIHHVTIEIITTQNHTPLDHQQYTIEVYVTTNESLSLQCFPASLSRVPITPEQHQPLPEMTINIPSQCKVRLEQSNILIVPDLDGKSWSLNCSASDHHESRTLQDMLTHFTKFQNRQNIRNTLAMISPSSYQVIEVVAENVSLGQGAPNENKPAGDDQGADDHTNSVVDDDDFISARENYYGEKLSVTMDENAFKDGLELRKVRLIRKTSQCMDVTSEWLARGIVSAGDSIAGYIQSGSNSLDENIKTPPATHQLVSSKQRKYFDIIFHITAMVGNKAGEWFSKIFHLTTVKRASAEFRMPTPKTQLGNSALQAAQRVMEGSWIATGTVLSASRQGLIQIIENKYGSDAGYMAKKIMGTDKQDEDVMVYFDRHGISRKVIMQTSHSISSPNLQKTVASESSHSSLVYDFEEQGSLIEEK